MKKMLRSTLIFCLMLMTGSAAAQTAVFNNTLKAANNGDKEAIYNIGYYYMRGEEGVAQDYETAVKWFKTAADRGYSNALINLGATYYHMKDYESAIFWYQKALNTSEIVKNNENFEKCRYSIGLCYMELEQFDTAIQWFEKTLKTAKSREMKTSLLNQLGHCYFSIKDYETAVRYYKQFEKETTGDSLLETKYNIGACFWNIRNYPEAIRYWESNLSGFITTLDYQECIPEIHYSLGRAYYYGESDYPGIAKDESRGLSYLRSSANAGFGKAMIVLTNHYLFNDNDFEAAASWFEKAKNATVGIPGETQMAILDSYMNSLLRNMIRDGEKYLEEKDFQKAIDKVKYLADRNDPQAQFITGAAMHRLGRYGATSWLENAAAQNNLDALSFLAHMYLETDKPDYSNARKWFYQAKNAGCTDIDDVERAINSPAAASYYAKMERDRKRAARRYRMSVFNDPEDPERCAMLTLGYVNKCWEITEGDDTGDTGYFDNSLIHGIQAGIRYNPKFSHGFGLHTGLYYEYYAENQHNQTIEDEWGYPVDCDVRFEQHEIYIPAHLEFRANFSEGFNMFVNAGIGFNYCFYARELYHNMEDYENYSYDAVFKDNTLIKPFNITREIGLGVQFSDIQIQATFAKGLINMSSEEGVMTYQKKPLTISLGFIF